MNFPSLNTDSFYKFITILGLFVFAFSSVTIANRFRDNRDIQLSFYADSLLIMTEIRELELDKELLEYKIKSNSEMTKDSLFFIELQIKRFENKIKFKQGSIEKRQVDKEDSQYYLEFVLRVFIILFFLSYLAMVWGFYAWYNKQQKLKDKEQLREYIDLGWISLICQSCGKRLSKDSLRPKEKNGNYNYLYCCDCYENGGFIEPNITLKQMKKKIGKKYKSKIRLWWRLLQIDYLKRWQ